MHITRLLLTTFCVLGLTRIDAPGQSWYVAANTKDLRYDASSVQLADGRIVIMGGGRSDLLVAAVEIYDYRDNSVTIAADMPRPLQAHQSLLLDDGRILIAGGTSPIEQAERFCAIYDPLLDEWTEVAPMLQGRLSFNLLPLSGGRAMAVGGTGVDPESSELFSLASCEMYDPVTDSWTELASLPSPRNSMNAVVLENNQILAPNGYNSFGGYDRSCHLYKPDEDTWTETGPFQYRGTGAHAMTMMPDGRILRSGGWEGPQNFCEIYDPQEGVWSVTGSMVFGRFEHAQVVMGDGDILAIAGQGSTTGSNSKGTLRSVERFSPASNTWELVESLPIGLTKHRAHSLPDGNVVVIGGGQLGSFGAIASNRIIRSEFAELIPPSKVNGQIWYDFDGNGQIDGADKPMSDVQVNLDSSPYSALSNSEGEYSIFAYPGQYELCAPEVRHWTPSWPQTESKCHTVEVNGDGAAIGGLDFGMQPIGAIRELDVCIIAAQARPGFELSYWLTYRNSGTVPYNGTLQFTYDQILEFDRASESADDSQAGLLLWELENVAIGEERIIEITFTVPADIELLGRELCAAAEYDRNKSDILLRAGRDEFCDIIRGSYDPNEIIVSPRGAGPKGAIARDVRVLSYTIYFQNLGTDTAFNIRISNVLDADLDPYTVEFGASSHPVNIHLSENRSLVFTFDDILLPAKIQNEAQSQGFVRYYISAGDLGPEEVPVINLADIYFDFNPAVRTNSVLTTYTSPTTAVETASPALAKLQLRPNPSNGNFLVSGLTDNPTSVKLIDVLGNEHALNWRVRASQLLVNTLGLRPGVYWFNLTFADGGVRSLPLVIAR